MSEKQQASLLLLQGEKGSLAMKVDALKEENDTLRAKNKNLLHNQQRTGDAHKAEQDAEIALLRKEREGFQADLQASRLQSSVALQAEPARSRARPPACSTAAEPLRALPRSAADGMPDSRCSRGPCSKVRSTPPAGTLGATSCAWPTGRSARVCS